MNHATLSVLNVIENTQALLDRIFQGMFSVAREYLGYGRNGRSYPFVASLRSPDIQHYDIEAANFSRQSAYSLQLSGGQRSVTADASTLFVTASRDAKQDPNSVFLQAKRVLQSHGESDLNMKDVNTNQITQTLFDKHFAHMLGFANQSRHYRSRWQELALPMNV